MNDKQSWKWEKWEASDQNRHTNTCDAGLEKSGPPTMGAMEAREQESYA